MAAPAQWKTIPAYAAHMATLLPQRPPAARLTKELRSLRSPFTKTRICLPLHCTACWSNIDVTCPVVVNLLPALNEWFLNLAVEVHEIKPGRLALCAVENDTKARGITWEGNHAAILLHCLLTSHRCLEVLDGLRAVLSCYSKVFCDALRNGVLNVLRLSKCELTSGAARSLMASIRGCECIVELSLKCCKFHSSSVQAAEDAVAGIVAKSKSLRLLDVAESALFHDSTALILSLEKNRSIEGLVVGPSVLTAQQETSFRRFLRNNVTLRTLTIVAGCIANSPKVDSVFDALLENSVLDVLRLKGFYLDLAAAVFFVRLIVCNKTLSEVDFSGCSWEFLRKPQVDDSRRQDPIYSYAADFVGKVHPAQPLTLALKKTSSLQRLLVQETFSENYSRLLLEGAADCSSLEQLTFNLACHAASFYRALGDSRASDKVRLGTCYWMPTEFVLALQSWGDLLGLGCHRFIKMDEQGFHKVVVALPLHDHITELDLQLGNEWDGVTEEDASLIAGYVSSTRVLKDICMRFNISEPLAHVVVEGLCKNTTIEKLSIEDWQMHCDDVRRLCSWVAASRKVYHLVYLCAEPQACWTLVKSLAQELLSSYTLTYVRVVEYPSNAHIWQTVKQLRRRNLALVECAVSFVLGSTLKRAAAAFERMWWHPQVASKVQHQLRAGPEEVGARLQECRRHVQMAFWQITGVVRGELVCHERVDGRKQIDQLGVDAWLCVRAFLRVDDVLDRPGKKQSRKRKRR